MGKEEVKKAAQKALKNVEVVTLGDYITKIGTKLSGQPKTKAAIELLYSENNIIAVLERKGATYFVVEK